MSYGLVGHFFEKDKEILTVGLDHLKILNTIRYSAEFEDIEEISKPNFIKIPDDVQMKFYNLKCFTEAFTLYKKKAKTYKQTLKKLKKLKNSINYYKLNEESKGEIEQEILDTEEIKEDFYYKLRALEYIINCFLCVENLEINNSYYRNQEDLCVGIEVS